MGSMPGAWAACLYAGFRRLHLTPWEEVLRCRWDHIPGYQPLESGSRTRASRTDRRKQHGERLAHAHPPRRSLLFWAAGQRGSGPCPSSVVVDPSACPVPDGLRILLHHGVSNCLEGPHPAKHISRFFRRLGHITEQPAYSGETGRVHEDTQWRIALSARGGFPV